MRYSFKRIETAKVFENGELSRATITPGLYLGKRRPPMWLPYSLMVYAISISNACWRL